MAYQQSVVDQIAARINIVSVIGDYIPLKKAGTNFKALCPFHAEKTPSFVVSPDKQIFHCFGCHAGGDVFSFVMKYENLTFPEALKFLADRCGVVVETEQFKRSERRKKEPDLKQINKEAMVFYHDTLLTETRAHQARKYLALRGFDNNTIKSFQIGFALSENQTLLQYLTRKGYSRDVLLRSGLFRQVSEGAIRDLFNKRIIFPILNARDEVIGFGGRVLDDSLPKYLNTPETPYFRKREELFGLNKAKRAINTHDSVLIVEGYFDLMRLHQKGFEHAVATLGTALTKSHYQVLRRYTKNIIMIFDTDQAGVDATMRGAELGIEEGFNVRVLTLPGSKDPDDFLNENDVPVFQDMLNSHTKDFFDFKCAFLCLQYDRNDVAGLARIIDHMLGLLLKVDNQIMIDKYIQKLARDLNVSEFSVRSELEKKQGRTRRVRGERTHTMSSEKKEDEKKERCKEEDALIAALVRNPDLYFLVESAGLSVDAFNDPINRAILQLWDLLRKESDSFDGEALVRRTDNDDIKHIITAALLDEREIENPNLFVKERIREIILRNKRRELSKLKKDIDRQTAHQETETETFKQTCAQFTQLKKEISDLVTVNEFKQIH